MQMWMKSKEVAKCLHHNNGSGYCFLFQDHFRDKFLQGFPPASTQVRKQFAIIKKISAKKFWHAEDKMPVWNRFKHLFTKLLAKFHDPLLVAGWTEVTAFA
jgi:hypothetical protein